MQQVVNPIPFYRDRQGNPLAGKLYVGESGKDPETFPLDVFWDAALTQPATQPLSVVGGYVRRSSAVAPIFVAESDYSFRTKEADGDEVIYVASSVQAGTAAQPLDADLTAISALTTTAYGRNLLTLANQAALVAATGLSSGLPTTGGTVTGDITRSGEGKHLYLSGDSGVTSGEVHVIDFGAAKPTTGIVFERAS